MLTRAGEPLFEMQRIQKMHRQNEAEMREQRDEIVREMHDGLGSQLFGASLLSNVTEKMTEQDLRRRFREVGEALSDAMDSLRTGLTVLSAPPGTFGPAMMALLLRAERILSVAGIVLLTESDEEATSVHLNSHSVFGVLRAVQEALTNVARHSRATEARVRLHTAAERLEILISDNGSGFDLNQQAPGHGLTNIQRRMQMLGGQAEIHSMPGGGSTISLQLPLQNGVS
jgi:signal transduction histidine kinase